MPNYVISRCEETLKAHGKTLQGSRILILGLAYKPNVDDDRESPSYVLMQVLETMGAEVHYHDPHIPEIRLNREHGKYAGRQSVEPSGGYDLFLLATNHDTYSVTDLKQHGVPVIDTRHIQSSESADWKFA
jgi:UDP-N-acetyl-D-glucosamine dehydrogenase